MKLNNRRYTSNNILKAQIQEITTKGSSNDNLINMKSMGKPVKLVNIEDSTTINLMEIMTNMFSNKNKVLNKKQMRTIEKTKNSHVNIARPVQSDLAKKDEQYLEQILINKSNDQLN